MQTLIAFTLKGNYTCKKVVGNSQWVLKNYNTEKYKVSRSKLDNIFVQVPN